MPVTFFAPCTLAVTPAIVRCDDDSAGVLDVSFVGVDAPLSSVDDEAQPPPHAPSMSAPAASTTGPADFESAGSRCTVPPRTSGTFGLSEHGRTGTPVHY